MRKIIIIAVLAFVLFLIEFLLFNLLGSWFKPNFSIILIVFINLYWGIRFSLVSAFISGLLKDCFSVNIFGFNIFAFIVCAFMVTFIKKNIFHIGSSASRVQMAFVICIINVLVHYILNVTFHSAQFWHVIGSVMVPEVLTTTIIASFAFTKIKNVIERYSI